MLIEVLYSKIHRVKVTQAELHYVGSVAIDLDLIEASNLIVGQKVQILNIENGLRFETYVIEGERASGTICLNGPAARNVQVGDNLIIVAYAQMSPEEARDFTPTAIFPNENNRL